MSANHYTYPPPPPPQRRTHYPQASSSTRTTRRLPAVAVGEVGAEVAIIKEVGEISMLRPHSIRMLVVTMDKRLCTVAMDSSTLHHTVDHSNLL